MPFPFKRHPVHALPFEAAVANELEQEYRRLPLRARIAAMRKVMQRELVLLATGQWRRRLPRLPATARRVLWVYTWTTVGDSLMDLSVRRRLPAHLQIDLAITPSLAPLYAADPAFGAVLTIEQACRREYDFVLLQDLTTSSLKLKWRCSPTAPFATVFEHLRGERFDRTAFAQRRMEQLVGIAAANPQRPYLSLPEAPPQTARGDRFEVAVALGARDARRRYRRWPEVLAAVLARWPAARPAPLFVLIGSANARDDLGTFDPAFLAQHCRVEIDTLDLLGTARLIDRCAAFLGADGGLMHLAAALDKPGAALFVEIDPALRLQPGARIEALFTPHTSQAVEPAAIASVFVRAVAAGAA